MRILVTGGAGFIGSHLVERLINDGHDVLVVDNLSSGSKDWVSDKAELIVEDLQNINFLKKVLQGVEVIFHLAAMSRSGPSIDQPELCFNSNILGTHNILSEAMKSSVNRIIYSASSTCYGNQPIPHTITTPVDLLNYYSQSKYAAEQELLVAARTGKMKVVSLRYFNVYGPRQPLVGNYALVTGIFTEAKRNNQPVVIHGDGRQTRDFIHVSDVVEANIKSMDDGVPNGAYNIGSGKNTSVLDLAKMLELNYSFGERRTADAANTLADISETKRFLKWGPKVELADGLSQLI